MNEPLESPLLPVTPTDSLGELISDRVLIEDRAFLITHPRNTDRLLDLPAVREAFQQDEYMPYWADLWPGSRMLGKYLVKQSWPAGLHTLEIGCGLGLSGIVALSLGLKVTFSDYDATALKFASDNARANGFTNFDTLQMDWRFPPPNTHFPLILAADLIYERRNVPALIGLVRQLLAPDGLCILTDQDRPPCHFFRESLTAEGLHWDMQIARAGEPGGRRFKGTLYRIRLVPPSADNPDYPALGGQR